jgi:hypothetical protein
MIILVEMKFRIQKYYHVFNRVNNNNNNNNSNKGKVMLVTDHGGPYGCEILMLSHFLDNWFTDGGEVVSLMHRLPFRPRKISGTHIC